MMTIVKQFEDEDMVKVMNKRYLYPNKFYWGLHENGNLCYKIFYLNKDLCTWYFYDTYKDFPVPFKSMIKIVSKFKHLLPFI